jgi:hypothetical protein
MNEQLYTLNRWCALINRNTNNKCYAWMMLMTPCFAFSFLLSAASPPESVIVLYNFCTNILCAFPFPGHRRLRKLPVSDEWMSLVLRAYLCLHNPYKTRDMRKTNPLVLRTARLSVNQRRKMLAYSTVTSLYQMYFMLHGMVQYRAVVLNFMDDRLKFLCP